MLSKKMVFTQLVVMMILICRVSYAAELTKNSWTDLSQPGWSYFHYNSAPEIVPVTDSSIFKNALRFTYPEGLGDGKSTAMAYFGFEKQYSELWIQYYFKYASNWTWHPTGQKHFYVTLGENSANGDWYVRVSGGQKMTVCIQARDGMSFENFYPNTSYNPTIQKDRWYRVTLRAVLNTAGMKNGIAQLWIDGGLVINSSQVGFRGPNQGGMAWGGLKFDPIWGGGGGPVPALSYLYIGDTTIATAPLSGLNVLTIPSPPSNLTIN